MTILTTTKELITYKEAIERQLSVLHLSTVFTDEQREEMKGIYSKMITICNERIETRKKQNIEALNNGAIL